MKIEITHKYLVFPVNTLSASKRMTISSDDGLRYGLNICLDPASPDFFAYVDVSAFMGRTVTVSTDPEMEISCRESDEIDIPSLYRESYRPQVHFTTKNGWINDPNGLVYLNGEYHLFYQHNPCENSWGNMHWGHAVSRDLLHWEEKDIALFPDKTGVMFSGSAVIDEKNLLGLQEGDTPTALLYYTATDPFAQYVAYSTDGLKTIKKRNEAPVVPNITGDNRDPKVVFCEEWNAYAMALYLEGDVYGILRSEDLLHWDLVQRIALPGDNECPDLFPIVADNGERKWVLIGAHDRYLVGDMRQDGFCPSQEPISLHHGKGAYAGQSYSGLPNGRVVRVDWDRWHLPTPNINGQMGFPMELTLSDTNGVYYLSARPIGEIAELYDQSSQSDDLVLSAGVSRRIDLARAPYLIKMDLEPTEKLTLGLFGIHVRFSGAGNRVSIGNESAPITLTSSRWDIVMLVDKCSMELYLDEGRVYLGTVDRSTYCDYYLPYLELTSAADCVIKRLELHSLKSIWHN